ncbi:MAG: EamA family transporter [Patescibacteria group bacterium]
MSWQLLVLISVVSTSFASLFQKVAMKDQKSDPVVSAIAFQFILGFILSIFALAKGFQLPDSSMIPFFLASGVLYGVGTVCFFKAIKIIEASKMTILGGSGVIVTILASMIFLGDKLSPMQLFGTGLILCAVVLISWEKKSLKVNNSTWLALAGTSSYGLAVVFDTFIIRSYSAVWFLPLASFGPGILMTLWYFRRIKSIVGYVRQINKNLIIYCMLYAVQAVAFYVALENGAVVGQISSISRTSIVLTVILAAVVLRETKHVGKKIVGAVLTTIGVLLVA